MEFVIERGFAPDSEELADLLDFSVEEVEGGLRALQEYHGIVLHPGSTRIWVIHPFSAAPTNFLVRAGNACGEGTAGADSGDVARVAGSCP